jgi:hypothetical protein
VIKQAIYHLFKQSFCRLMRRFSIHYIVHAIFVIEKHKQIGCSQIEKITKAQCHQVKDFRFHKEYSLPQLLGFLEIPTTFLCKVFSLFQPPNWCF